MARRGQCLPVAKKTRDYLVRKTNGAWKDFDPEVPEEEIDHVLPPQFGEEIGPQIDLDDVNPETNPPISMEHAMALAAKSEGDFTPNGSGDIKGADLAAKAADKGATAKNAPAKKPPTKAKPKAETPTPTVQIDTADVEVVA